MAMRGLILAMVAGLTPLAVQAQPAAAPTPLTAQAQTAAAAAAPLARQLLEESGGANNALSALRELAQSMADGYAAGARETNQPVDQKALDRAVRDQIAAYKTQFLEAHARQWARQHTAAELNQVLTAVRSKTVVSSGLMGKMPFVNRQSPEVLGALAPKLYRDIFIEYCSTSPCTDNVKKRIARSASN